MHSFTVLNLYYIFNRHFLLIKFDTLLKKYLYFIEFKPKIQLFKDLLQFLQLEQNTTATSKYFFIQKITPTNLTEENLEKLDGVFSSQHSAGVMSELRTQPVGAEPIRPSGQKPGELGLVFLSCFSLCLPTADAAAQRTECWEMTDSFIGSGHKTESRSYHGRRAETPQGDTVQQGEPETDEPGLIGPKFLRVAPRRLRTVTFCLHTVLLPEGQHCYWNTVLSYKLKQSHICNCH